MQKIIKTLIEENVDLQACFHENRALRGDIKQLSKVVQELSDSNSALNTRLNLLELWYARTMSAEGKRQKIPTNDPKHNGQMKKPGMLWSINFS